VGSAGERIGLLTGLLKGGMGWTAGKMSLGEYGGAFQSSLGEDGGWYERDEKLVHGGIDSDNDIRVTSRLC
jgi:hypothetical protein